MTIAAYLRLATLVGAVAGLAGCSSNPAMIVSDDATLCRYAADVGGAESMAACRNRLDKQQRIQTTANASRIEGYALLNTPAAPTAIADQCRQPNPPHECGTGDVTGTIKRDPANSPAK
ncbi:hypothetical protein [Undibacter mobilis]|uniref:Uncharacterized protein n=1 Tax=Undibacter mobilis TaxID=2292256 RepID=A0A371BBT6_9BRAD|nr:hypothetical protein [Undibacter mobilis]RDV05056.1 hypothetical protein DXH78_11065 [Undibacter mobilis]